MGLYEGIKDVAKVVQQADNIELYRQLLDLSAQALDMQAEIATLREENASLKNTLREKKNIVRHPIPIITLADDDVNAVYCAVCYGKDGNLIQMRDTGDYYFCRACSLRAYKSEARSSQQAYY